MKKISILLFTLFFSFTHFVFSQEENQVAATDENESTGQLLTKSFTGKDYSHWSFTIDAGLNTVLPDMAADYGLMFKKPLQHLSLGATAEYTINPAFSLGLAYMYNTTNAIDGRGSFDSKLHHIYPFLGFNFLNYTSFNRNKKWDFWLTAGVGAVHYNSELRHVYNNTAQTVWGFTEEEWENDKGVSHKNRWAAVIPLGFELDYNISSQFAIGIKYQHFIYTEDDLEGGDKKLKELDDKYGRKNYTYGGVSNDQMSNFLLTFRWNVPCKEKEHMRHVSWVDYQDNRDDKLKDELNDRIGELENRLDDLANKVANINVNPVVVNNNNNECPCPEEFYSIYFDFDKYNLNRDALITISKVVERLKADESLKVRIVGYTDVDGTDNYNDKLSTRRAEKAKNELVKMWGVSADRITTSGEGKLTAPNRDYHVVSRRCDLFIEKK